MTTPVAMHCDRTAFVFLPNLCNAKCEFCYVRPAFSQAAHASKAVLKRAQVTAEALSILGFSTVRFSGGEPTLFDNLSEVVRPFIDRGLTYRVLTNGIDVDHCLEFFTAQPPDRFTLSVHTTSRPEAVFGVPVTIEQLAENRRLLSQIARVEATIVVEDVHADWKSIEMTLAQLKEDGVDWVKLILENSVQTRDGGTFLTQAHRIRDHWKGEFRSMRISDTHQDSCKLTQKGFPAIELGRGLIYACCVQVGDRPVVDGYSEPLLASGVATAASIQRLIERSTLVESGELPCSAADRFCPLALR